MMQFVSTRGQSPAITLSAALRAGLAPDGGLYVPAESPHFTLADFDGVDDLADVATRLLTPFFADDALLPALPGICQRAFDFPIVLKPLKGVSVLELMHGPTAAFKDFGARFLAECLSALMPNDAAQPLTIVVATSGDTGGAVAAAFAGRVQFRVLILYPKDKVSKRQETQLTCWPDNVTALRVAGTFDDCQRIAKALLNDPQGAHLSSANSISLGRVLPQMSYYAWAAVQHARQSATPLQLVIPSGNLGNALAAIWTRQLGLPIGEIQLACNANATLSDFFNGEDYRARPSVETLASAMDVGAPSNFERLQWLIPNIDALRQTVRCTSVDDREIERQIVRVKAEFGEIICPHTATGFAVAERLVGEWTVVATADPAKFESIVEPLLGEAVPIPRALAALIDQPTKVLDVNADLSAVRAQLR